MTHYLQDRMLAPAALPRISFHDLRHSAALLLLSRRVQPRVIAEVLGRSGAVTTMALYSHVFEEQLREAAELLDA